MAAAQLASRSFQALHSGRRPFVAGNLCWMAQRQLWLRPRPQQLADCQRRHGGGRRTAVRVAAARDPYDLLGVPRTASVDDIKKAFRKRALKLHPDVNKAPDAMERFMEAKQAYQQLLDEREGRASSSSGFGSASARSGSSAAGGSSSWGYRGSTGAGSSGAGYQQRQRKWEPEETYSFSASLQELADRLQSVAGSAAQRLGDLLRDLDKEISDYTRERQQRKAAASGSSGGSSSSSGGGPKTLWEELYDIGEEFVDFLEQGLGVSDDEASSYGDFKRKYGDLSGSGASDARAYASGASSGASSSSSGTRPGGSSYSGSGSGAGSGGYAGSSSYGSGMGASAGPSKKSTAEYVEDELAALKRKLGKQ